MRRIILLAVSSIFILSACGNNQSVITEAKVEETIKETIIETTVEETTTTQETTISNEEQEILDLKAELESMTGNEIFDKYGEETDKLFERLENAGYYMFVYDYSNEKMKFYDRAGLEEKIRSNMDEDGWGIKSACYTKATHKIYDEIGEAIRKPKKEQKEREMNEQVQSMIIRLSAPKTVDQIGGNRQGDNDGTYKGEFRQEPRRYGQDVFPGSMLVAVNGMYGDENTAQQYYECRNGFVILNNAGFKFRDNMLKTETERAKVSIFDKVEFEVFKLNNPNAKIIEQDYNRDYDEYGTFSTSGQPLWQENYGQPVITILGRCMHQEGTIIDGQLTTKQWTTQGYRNAGCSDNGGASAPWCRDGAGNRNEQYDLEVVWRGGIEGGHINTIEERNAVIRRYITK